MQSGLIVLPVITLMLLGFGCNNSDKGITDHGNPHGEPTATEPASPPDPSENPANVGTRNGELKHQPELADSELVTIPSSMLAKFPAPFEGGKFRLSAQLGVNTRDSRKIQEGMLLVYEMGKTSQLEAAQLANPVHLRPNEKLHLPALSQKRLAELKRAFADGFPQDVATQARQIVSSLFERQIDKDLGESIDISLVKTSAGANSARLPIPAPLRSYDLEVTTEDGLTMTLSPNIRKGDRFDFLILVPQT